MPMDALTATSVSDHLTKSKLVHEMLDVAATDDLPTRVRRYLNLLELENEAWSAGAEEQTINGVITARRAVGVGLLKLWVADRQQ